MSENHEEYGNELEERLRGLESLLGLSDDIHLHGVIPFFAGLEMGGTPDVVTFSNYTTQGKLYVTCELVGTEQPQNEEGQYELAVCQMEPDQWALDLILKLSYYTLENVINKGETMDIGPAVPRGSNIKAFLFKSLGTYTAFDKAANVLCCIGITRKELKHCFKYGSKSLFDKIPDGYILTETKRKNFL